MATIALAAVGSAVGGSTPLAFGLTGGQLLGAAGGIAGSLIDQQYLFSPKESEVPSPRVDDYQLQTNSEGSPIKYVLGPENRIAGTTIWVGRHGPEANQTLEVRTVEKEVGGKGGGGATQTTHSYFADVAIAVCEGEVNAIRKIWADSKVIYATGTEDSRYEGISLYTGGTGVPADDSMTANITPNSHMESFEGAGNVPKYNGLCYVVIDSLHLGDWGNRIPTFTFLVERQENLTVAQAVAELCERGGLTSGQYDVSRVPGCFTGYHVAGPVSMVRALEPLLLAYDLTVQERGGKLHFFERGDEQVGQVVETDLATADEGANRARPLSHSVVADFDTPTHVLVRHIDPDFNYERGEQSAQRINYTTPNVETIDTPIVMRPTTAATLAKRRLYRAWSERDVVKLSLPWSYMAYIEGDVLLVPTEGETYRLIIQERDQGDNGVLNFTCAVQSIQTVTTTEDAADTTASQTHEGTPYVAPDMDLVVADLPALIDEHTVSRVLLVATATATAGAQFRGATLYSAGTDTDGAFTISEPLLVQATMGTTDTNLGGGVAPELWDYTNTVTISLQNGTLESANPEDVIRGRNMLLIGSEVVGFQTATLVSDGVYELSGLLRGVRHTHTAIEDHVLGEPVLLLEGASVVPVNYPSTQQGTDRYYRSVAADGQVDGETSITLTPAGNSVKAWSPVQITTSRDVSDNVAASWVRRTRAVWDISSPVEAPLVEGQEVYAVEFLDGPGGSVARTTTVTDDTNVAYTAAQQTADGLTPGDPVYFRIYMVDSVFGRGFPTTEHTIA